MCASCFKSRLPCNRYACACYSSVHTWVCPSAACVCMPLCCGLSKTAKKKKAVGACGVKSTSSEIELSRDNGKWMKALTSNVMRACQTDHRNVSAFCLPGGMTNVFFFFWVQMWHSLSPPHPAPTYPASTPCPHPQSFQTLPQSS